MKQAQVLSVDDVRVYSKKDVTAAQAVELILVLLAAVIILTFVVGIKLALLYCLYIFIADCVLGFVFKLFALAFVGAASLRKVQTA